MARDTAAKTFDNRGFIIVDEDTHALPMLRNDWYSYESKKAPVYKGDTIEALAKEAGLDSKALVAIVKEYNEALAAKKLDTLTPPNTHKNSRIKTKSQVLDTEGKVIKGLFAAGGLFYDNYVGGAQLTSAAVIGRKIADYMKDLNS